MCGCDRKHLKLRFLKNGGQFLAILRRFNHAKLQPKTTINGYWRPCKEFIHLTGFKALHQAHKLQHKTSDTFLTNLAHSIAH